MNCSVRTSSIEENSIYLGAIITTNVCFGLQSVLLNCLVLGFYRKKRQETINNLIYFFFVICDLLSGFDALLHAATFLLFRYDDKISTTEPQKPINYFIMTTFTIGSVTSRTRYLYNLVLAVVRSFNIIYPLYTFQRDTILWFLLPCPIFWMMVLAAEETVNFSDPSWKNICKFVIFPSPKFPIGENAVNAVIRKLMMVIPFIIPYLGVLVSMIHQGLHLCKVNSMSVFDKSKQARRKRKRQRERRKSQTTEDIQRALTQEKFKLAIFYISVLFVVCNTPCAAVLSFLLFNDNLNAPVLLYLVNSQLQLIVAAFNPIIFINSDLKVQQAVRRKSANVMLGLRVRKNKAPNNYSLSPRVRFSEDDIFDTNQVTTQSNALTLNTHYKK